MSLYDALARAQADLDRGDLGKARDRLEGRLQAHPSELEVRRRLGFENRHSGTAWQMLDAVGFHGGLASMTGTYADTVVRDLAARSGASPAKLEAALRQLDLNEPTLPEAVPRWARVLPGLVVVIIGLILLLAGKGAIAVFSAP